MTVLDPTLETKNVAPGYGVQGKNVLSSSLPPRVANNSFPQNGLPLNQKQKNSENFSNVQSHEMPVILDEKNSEKIYDPDDTTRAVSIRNESILSIKETARKIMTRVPYEEKYSVMMIEFFMEKPKQKTVTETFTWRNGEVDEKYKSIACAPPMFSEFARTIGVSERTLKAWAKKDKDFQEAYEVCQDIIQEFIVENGLSGQYPGQFTIFAAKNLTRMKDVQVNKNENYDMKSILDAIEKGSVIEDSIW